MPVEELLPGCDYCCGRNIPLRYVSLALLTFQTTLAVVLTRYSLVFADTYYSTSLVVSSELTKLLLSLLFVFVFDCDVSTASSGVVTSTVVAKQLEDGPQEETVSETPESSSGKTKYMRTFQNRLRLWKNQVYTQNLASPFDTLKLAVPALLYTVQNNLIYVALQNLEATTFQVGYQSKVITTAVLSVLMLNRTLGKMKWSALLLLTTGIVLTQVSNNKATGATAGEQSVAVGVIAVVASAFCSAFAGVYFEKILKGTNPSVWMRNTQLAFFSVIIAIFTFFNVEGLNASFFKGYSPLVWSIIAVQAAGGLIIATVIKYADNILKGFATAISIILCGLFSYVFMGFIPSMSFLAGCVLTIAATFMYAH